MATHIEINDDHELYIWARMFGVTPQYLIELIGEVGPSAERVREVLKQRELAKCRGRDLPANLRRSGDRR